MNSKETKQRQIRHFSEEFKREKVKYIEDKTITPSELSREYNVSLAAIYKWIIKYSDKYKKAERVVIEKESEEHKRIKLLSKVAELERMIGQKQMEVEYLNKVIELGSELTGVDIKKKFDTQS